jgi:hypothetical protein
VDARSSRELSGFIMAYLGNARLNIKIRIMTSSPSFIISLNMFPSPLWHGEHFKDIIK